MIPLQGVYAAAVTPRGKQGDIDFGASFELIDFLCRGGMQGVALCGANGEFASLTTEERSRLVYLGVKRSRAPVLVGIGSTSLETSIDLGREARSAGAAGLLLPPPHFFTYEQDDLREFYLQFAHHLGGGIPTYLSRLPNGGSNLAPSTALELLQTGRFAGIELGLRGIAAGSPWSIFAVEDADLVEARRAGAHASLSAVACAVPELVAELDRALQARDEFRVQQLDARLQEFVSWMHQFPQPVAVKLATGWRGLKTGPLSLPLPAEKVRKCEDFREWFECWLPVTKKLAANG